MKIEKESQKIFITGNIKSRDDAQLIIDTIKNYGEDFFIELHLINTIAVLSDLLIFLIEAAKKRDYITVYIGNKSLYNFLQSNGYGRQFRIRKATYN